MNPDNFANRKLNKEKAALNASIDNFVNSVTNYLNGNREKARDIQESLILFNGSSSALMEELRKQNKYNKLY